MLFVIKYIPKPSNTITLAAAYLTVITVPEE